MTYDTPVVTYPADIGFVCPECQTLVHEAVTMPVTRSLTPLDKIDRDLRAARQLRLMPRSPEQDERLQAEIDRLLDERNALATSKRRG